MGIAQAVDVPAFGGRDASHLPPIATVLVQVAKAIEVTRAGCQITGPVAAQTPVLMHVLDAI
jgi:hypothetical protein